MALLRRWPRRAVDPAEQVLSAEFGRAQNVLDGLIQRHKLDPEASPSVWRDKIAKDEPDALGAFDTAQEITHTLGRWVTPNGVVGPLPAGILLNPTYDDQAGDLG